MHSPFPGATRSYANVGVETGVLAASPHKLVLMLFEGAKLSVAMAVQHIQKNEIADKGMAISKAIDIIANGLRASLDIEAGGELAERLAALYDYMCARLLHANIHSDVAALEEVGKLLGELLGAWAEIANDPAVLSANQAAA